MNWIKVDPKTQAPEDGYYLLWYSYGSMVFDVGPKVAQLHKGQFFIHKNDSFRVTHALLIEEPDGIQK